jgi:ATP-binding cassette subfamily C protein CydC
VKPLCDIFRLIVREQRTAMLRGAALSLAVIVMGVTLLGLSGWFITAAAAAGLAGAGAVFDVFRPSASGTGKSTLLLAIAGLHPVAVGEIVLGGRAIADWPETVLRRHVTLLPQRSSLMAGTFAEALELAGPVEENRLWDILAATQLDRIVEERGGLSARIGPRGDGLSGGEARRLVLARALLRSPDVLLLDEPTEGLDDATAYAVLQGIRHILPEAAILIAAHRGIEIDFADRVIATK